ncbi:MAG: FtsH protease activity modulator HflK [Gammaproteobacteria bacterium]|nr:FtsH protease activity modulator HflK [Gammaproteobacteria bacterium]MDP2142037.1 FtsH protease activity modulator HflK [Gammaproteobacteria bacterium]MDP2348384.1 FtsH protease activity modulator HflK [Gammaproteobacteria bacterium]
MAWNEPGNKGNGNDPWGGGGRGNGDQRPPDIDEVIKTITRKVNSLFGGGNKSAGSTGGSAGGGTGGGVSSGLFGGVIVMLVVIWAAMGFYTVDESERGVVMRFGALRDETVMPGLRWNPPIIDSVQKVNISRVNTRSYARDMLTTDENIVNVSIDVQYVIQDPIKFVVVVRDPEMSLDHAAESAIRHVAGGTTMDRVLTQGRAGVAAEVRERLQRYMDTYDSGILISQVTVRNAQPPDAVQGAFDDVIKAREDEQRVQNEALAYANRVIPVARGEAQRIIEQANAYRDQVIARAAGEASRFEQLLTEYEKAPAVTRERLYIDAMQAVMTNSSKVLIDVEGGNSMFYLPLDQIIQQNNTRSAGATQLTQQQMREQSDQLAREAAITAADRARAQTAPVRGGR